MIVAVPAPSLTVTSATVTTAASLSVIVPVAVSVIVIEPTGTVAATTPLMLTLKLSLASTIVSLFSGTVKVLCLTRGAGKGQRLGSGGEVGSFSRSGGEVDIDAEAAVDRLARGGRESHRAVFSDGDVLDRDGSRIVVGDGQRAGIAARHVAAIQRRARVDRQARY